MKHSQDYCKNNEYGKDQESASKSLIHYMMFLKHCDDKLIFHVTTGELFL